MKNVTVFSADDLRCHKISSESTLSLLHGVPSFVRCRQSIFYNFVHLMIQEFLAADYILQLPLDDQIEAFQKLFGQPRFVAVFQLIFMLLRQSSIRQSQLPNFAHFLHNFLDESVPMWTAKVRDSLRNGRGI